ncbi:MAG TPA: glucosaminidase domain-containing protein [Saprospiraceae bacterium]|jgi:hypothetical protein|nr:glucosaminidase domain-containing protein [Saprospiraceae bacterium]HRO08479.1 glucosaminidase domain-containing protein [Saprospiraceae bacterium]HRP41864.1 glucosaminidase domain-containing protein [Saprospiraceae bacterium]
MKLQFFRVSVLCIIYLMGTAFDYPYSRKIVENYIDTYKDIAISEMRRTGIPASIKLAQGILESDFGRSPLAINARNHFGIKCGGDWSGTSYYLLDDDTDSVGVLIESCFRSFATPDESYIAHSDFLTNPAKKSRYGFLFNLDTRDYSGWANGLKFAGYASDPAYPQKLIAIIEKYQLFKYDEPIVISEKTDYADNVSGAKNKDSATDIEQKSDNTEKRKIKDTNSRNGAKINYIAINGLRAMKANGGETIQSIASVTGVHVSELLEYNEEIKSMDYVLASDELVYFERKKKNIEGKVMTHTVLKGETMYSISQQYGIRLESLLAKNNLTPDAMPLAGQEISLVRQLNQNQTPQYRLVERFDSYVDLGALR